MPDSGPVDKIMLRFSGPFPPKETTLFSLMIGSSLQGFCLKDYQRLTLLSERLSVDLSCKFSGARIGDYCSENLRFIFSPNLDKGVYGIASWLIGVSTGGDSFASPSFILMLTPIRVSSLQASTTPRLYSMFMSRVL